jgi:hypothetical protein
MLNILRNGVLSRVVWFLIEFWGRQELQLIGEPRRASSFVPRAATVRQDVLMFTAVLLVKHCARPWRRSKVIATVEQFYLQPETVFGVHHVVSCALNVWIY